MKIEVSILTCPFLMKKKKTNEIIYVYNRTNSNELEGIVLAVSKKSIYKIGEYIVFSYSSSKFIYYTKKVTIYNYPILLKISTDKKTIALCVKSPNNQENDTLNVFFGLVVYTSNPYYKNGNIYSLIRDEFFPFYDSIAFENNTTLLHTTTQET
jgi:hypothetical protein